MLQNFKLNELMESENHFKNRTSPKSQICGINKMLYLLLICFVASFFYSCNTAEVYVKSRATSYSITHKTLAVVQYSASVQCGNRIKENDCAGLAENPTLSAFTPTLSHYSVLDELLRHNKHLDIEVQDEIITNKKLEQAGYSYSFEKIKNNLSTLDYKRSSKYKKEGTDPIWTPQELAKVLGVDAVMLVINDDFYAKKTGGQIASDIILGLCLSGPLGLILGLATINQTLHVNPIEICLYDGRSGTLLYKYKNKNTRIYNKSFYKKLPYHRKYNILQTRSFMPIPHF